METVVMIIMALVGFSFVLKLTCHRWIGRIALSLLCALFIILTYDIATNQSKAQIADWLGQPELMLDMSVWLTIDVAFQLCFCVLSAKALSSPLSRTERIFRLICLWVPGLLIFPVLFAILTEAIFTMPGVDFAVIGWSLAAMTLILFPLLAYGMKWLIPETDIRLEMIFMINLIIAAIGIVATVNGRTAAVGTNEVEWTALAAVIGLAIATSLLGFFIYFKKKRSDYKNSKF